MFYLACTIFNNTTYDENIKYRKKLDEQVIYGPTLKIREKYLPGCLIFVAEMNNEKNKIEGIGLIKNCLVCDKRYKIYDNTEYNRYIYRGNYWLSREQLLEKDAEIIETLDNVLFKGKSNLKRRIGITVVTEKLFSHWDYELEILKNKIKKVFLYYFAKVKLENKLEEELEDKLEEELEDKLEETIVIIPRKRKVTKSKIFSQNYNIKT